MRIGPLGLLAAPFVFAAPTAFAAAQDVYCHHPMMEWGGWFMMPIMMILFVALIVAAVFVGLRLFGFTSGENASAADRSLAILRERFARGEIDQEEFEARKRRLEER